MNVAKKYDLLLENFFFCICQFVFLLLFLIFWKTTSRQKPHFSRYVSTATNTEPAGEENYQRYRIPAKC